jgi:hypothetical protein
MISRSFVFKDLAAFSFRAISSDPKSPGSSGAPLEVTIRIIAVVSEIVKIFSLFFDLTDQPRLGRRARPARQSQAEFHEVVFSHWIAGINARRFARSPADRLEEAWDQGRSKKRRGSKRLAASAPRVA